MKAHCARLNVMIQFKKREILFIFLMFIAVTTIVFSMGLFVGYELKSLTAEKSEIHEKN